MQKFCENCGAPLEKPDQRFCLQCGKPITKSGPAAPQKPAPVPQASRPPVPAVPAQAPPAKKGGGLLAGIVILGLLGLLVLGGLILLFADDDTGTGTGYSSGAGLPREAHDISDEKIAAEDIAQRDAALEGVAAALETGNEPAVLASLTAGSREKYPSGLGLSAAGSAALAAALRDAEPVREYPKATMYETSIGGKTLTFVMWKEGGSWKIAGL